MRLKNPKTNMRVSPATDRRILDFCSDFFVQSAVFCGNFGWFSSGNGQGFGLVDFGVFKKKIGRGLNFCVLRKFSQVFTDFCKLLHLG